MKRIALAAVVLVGGVVALSFVPSEATYRAIVPEVITKTEVVTEVKSDLVARVEEAQRAAMSEIDAKAQKAYDDAKAQALTAIELKVTTEYKKEIEAKEKELQKATGDYWRDRKRVEQLIRQAFPEDPHTAVAVAKCESGLNPKAHNPRNTNGTTDGGLWQINDVHNRTLEQMGLDKYNPEDATAFARMLYEKNGWRDWVCYTHGKIALR